ncbi:hypothetical protein RRG08_037861 [Elysia crispata]|uniref:Uncharacterized protein n=1 Tax=Elysia crispata TaxID=231223 RepID=A0AAE1DIH4_9GAST|nr:hypothetical protein RRG08_037861 [Elysia crispata]
MSAATTIIVGDPSDIQDGSVEEERGGGSLAKKTIWCGCKLELKLGVGQLVKKCNDSTEMAELESPNPVSAAVASYPLIISPPNCSPFPSSEFVTRVCDQPLALPSSEFVTRVSHHPRQSLLLESPTIRERWRVN